VKMRTAQVEVYTFDELSDDAKERAREWWRSNLYFQDADCLFSDFDKVAVILGVVFDQRQVPLMNGSVRGEPKIYYSGFWSQGDGACFEGYYTYNKGASRAVREYAPQDSVLHRIADDLQAIQRPAFYGLSASISHRGRYYHSGCMDIRVNHDERRPTDYEEEGIDQVMRDFADWMYRQLESEYEYQMSNEVVDECIRINEYEFNDDGSIF